MTSSDERPPAALPWIIGLLLVAIAAINPLDFITGASEFDRAATATATHTLIKLVLAVAATSIGTAGFLRSPRTRRLLNSVPGTGLLALAGVFCVTSVFAAPGIRTTSIASSLIFLGYLFFIITALATIGTRRVVICLVLGTAIYLLATWLLFILVPEKGSFTEYTSSTETVVRMGGLGHPNTIAKVAVAMGLMGLALLVGRSVPTGNAYDGVAIGTRGPWWTWIWVGVVLLATATTLATVSRTAILAGVAASAMMLLDRLYGRGGIALAASVTAGIIALLLAVSLSQNERPLSESAVGAVTKSGDVEELTSLTGRTVIWDEAIGLIIARPLTGWGLDSAATVMSQEATGTHSLMLHITFSAGLVAGGLLFGLLVWSFVFGAFSPYEWIRGLMVFILISGLVEDTIFESFPTMLTLLWIVGLLAPNLIHMDAAAHHTLFPPTQTAGESLQPTWGQS